MKVTAGMRYGKLVVVGLSAEVATAACDCGRTKVFRRDSFQRGHSRSCGCLVRERNRALKTKHGCLGSPTWWSWNSMLKRCRDARSVGYANYGGRGIRVCERWHTFAAFLADMGERPTGLTLDRINNSGNYEPGNCRWATDSEQCINRRPSKRLPNGTYAPRSSP